MDREPIRRGRIYVAPPGLQTSLHYGRISVRRGPRENMHRPSIDVLFRTAAHHYGPRVIGVVLTGAMDDGATGLAAVKTGGGTAIVQDPANAREPSMPARASERTDVDFSVPINEIAPLLSALVGQNRDGLPIEAPLRVRDGVMLETVEESTADSEARRSDELGPASAFTCPDCSGTLFEIRDGKRVRFRRRVGHAYSEETIVSAQNDGAERALWTALRAIEEREALMMTRAESARQRGVSSMADRFLEKSCRVHEDVERTHDLILNGRALEPVPATNGQNS